MRLAVISDIHANREALDAVFNSIEKHSIDNIICLGDLVNYGVDFEFCIEEVREKVNVCIMGNHDSTVVGKTPFWYMNTEAQKTARWTAEHLSEEHKNYLKNLELTHSINNILFVHSTPSFPEEWQYITNWFEAAAQFDNFLEHICFVGHSHLPGLYGRDEMLRIYQEGVFAVPSNEQYIVNVGSVGQPRDRDPRACYVIIDEEMETIEFIRVSYDIQKAYEKIASVGVSIFNAQRILVGI